MRGMLLLAACGARAAPPIENEVRVPCSRVTYATQGDPPRRLIVHGDRLLALVGDDVLSYPLEGGAPTTVVTQHVIGDAIVVGDQLVYSQYEGGGLSRVPLAGGAPVAFSGDMDGPQSIAPLGDGEFAVGGLTGVYRVGGDGKVTKFLGGEDIGEAISHDGDAYLTTGSAMVRLGTRGAPETVYAPAQGMVGAMVGDEHGIYFGGTDDGGADQVSRYDFATRRVRRIAGLDDTAIALALVGGELYAAVGDHVVLVRDGAVATIARAGAELSALTGDSAGVYYGNDDGAIVRVCVAQP